MQVWDMTQADLVKATGLSKPRISQYVNGTYEAKQQALYTLAEALKVNISWLMGNDVPMEINYEKLHHEINVYELIEKFTSRKEFYYEKKIGLFVVLLFIGGLAFGILQIAQNPEKYQTKDEVSVVLDCSKFSNISAEELKNELGEPRNIEDWNNKTAKGEFPLQIYTYDFDGFYGEFILHENTVVKLRLFSDSEWKIEGNKFDNIFTMFGIVSSKNTKKIVDTGVTYKFSPVSDKVAQVDFYNYDKENKTFNMVYITYNLNYFD